MGEKQSGNRKQVFFVLLIPTAEISQRYRVAILGSQTLQAHPQHVLCLQSPACGVQEWPRSVSSSVGRTQRGHIWTSSVIELAGIQKAYPRSLSTKEQLDKRCKTTWEKGR